MISFKASAPDVPRNSRRPLSPEITAAGQLGSSSAKFERPFREAIAWIEGAALRTVLDLRFGWQCVPSKMLVNDFGEALQAGVVHGQPITVSCDVGRTAAPFRKVTCALRFIHAIAHAQLDADTSAAGELTVRTYLQNLMEAQGIPTSADAYRALAAMQHTINPH